MLFFIFISEHRGRKFVLLQNSVFMKNKVCIISGANSGIGKITAKELSKQGARVIMLCRNKEKAEEAQNEIIAYSENPNVSLYIVDFSSQRDIRRVAKELNDNLSQIDVLVNNAGGIFDKRTLTEEGIEMTFAVNHLGYFLLTSLLLDKIKAAPKARIINVASQAQMLGTINFYDINLEKGFNAMKAYSQSKLANIMFSFELAERLKDSNITVNALHPGVVKTNFSAKNKDAFSVIFNLFSFLFKSPEKGAETSIWLASSAVSEGVTGKYFSNKREIKAQKLVYNVEARKKLWDLSEEMTKEIKNGETV